MKQPVPAGERPDYGIDAPYVIRNLLLAGLICVLIALALPSLRWFFTPAISFLATAAVWFYNSKFGKLRLREKLIDRLRLSGAETLLDVGCGSGLLLIGAASTYPMDRPSGWTSGAGKTCPTTAGRRHSATLGWKGWRNESRWKKEGESYV